MGKIASNMFIPSIQSKIQKPSESKRSSLHRLQTSGGGRWLGAPPPQAHQKHALLLLPLKSKQPLTSC